MVLGIYFDILIVHNCSLALLKICFYLNFAKYFSRVETKAVKIDKSVIKLYIVYAEFIKCTYKESLFILTTITIKQSKR